MTTIEENTNEYLPTPEQIAKDISASYDSALLITKILVENIHNDEQHEAVLRNTTHLRACLTLPHIIQNASDADKAAFSQMIEQGENWIA